MSVPLYVLFASATGNAEEISKRIHENNLTKKYPSKLFSLNDFKDKILAKKTDTDPYNMIIVASSTGNGDVPENGDKFWRFIKRTTTPATLFAGVNYGVLGLGDTNYDKFCFASKQIDKRVGELGGVKYCHHGAADDATGYVT
jgi:sulfite reductase alpha subunit-like flavoprotein